ncbi:MAG TPA: AraC family transcriptional regulator [Epsilonproteobacteria bacterium]|nr:AraC family transcriptional regulator [Campylobacterota bacterium]
MEKNQQYGKTMKIELLDEKQVFGISVRTTNANEMNPETAKIGKTWQKFDSQITIDYEGGERVYGVYYNYESDANDEFTVLAGTEKPNNTLEKVTIPKGKYLVFDGKASTPDDKGRVQAVIESWGKIWSYFTNDNAEHKRAYKTDFEYYKNQTEISIYISIL